jgi:D-3-phosphoglycerate dehydrogenase
MNHEKTVKKIVYPDANSELADAIAGERLEQLRDVGELQVHYGRPADAEEFTQRIGDAEAMLLGWGLPTEAMAAASNLELVSFIGIGAGNFVDLDEAARLGITVCNCPGYADNTVAEHALAMMLAAARHLARLDRDVRAGEWNQSLPGVELRGKRLGLVGFGGIGARFAEMARGIGMDVRAWTRNPDPRRAERHGITFESLDEILTQSDVLSLHVALSAETEGLMDVAALERTKPGVIIVNTARGEIIDEDALVAGLRSGHVATAALDVYPREPLPSDSPLLALDNALLTPHVAYNTPEASEMLMDIAVNNVVAYYRGTPVNVVAGPAARR